MTSHWGFKQAASAAQSVLRGDHDGIAWTFHHCMDARDRDAFDAALVSVNHPLASQAGTQESRFGAYVRELITVLEG